MQLIIKFATITSLFVTAFAAPTTSTEDIVNDLDDISDQFIRFINDMNSFNGDFAQGLAINDDATTLLKLIKNANTDVRGVPTPVSESDANSLIGIAEEIIVPDVESALEKLVEIKASLTQLPGASTLVSRDLSDLGTSSVELMESLKSAAPDNLKVKAQELEDRVKTAFRKADNAYGVDPGF